MNYKERQETFIKEFDITDINGQVHKAIMAGILTVEKWAGEDIKFSSNKVGIKTVTTKTVTPTECYNKELALGVSITNPNDEFNFELGVQIAEGRANKETKRLGLIISEDRGMLGMAMCNAIMDQQIQYIRENQTHFLVVKPGVPVMAQPITTGTVNLGAGTAISFVNSGLASA